MKILYGVVGEGMGHAMRSQVILEHLLEQGHDLQIMASGRAVSFLERRFASVTGIHGLHMIYEENRVRPVRTLWSNVLKGAVGIPKNIAAYFDLIANFDPEAVISDFESWTYLYGQTNRLPILSIDNMQVINRCLLPPQVLRGHRTAFKLTKAFIKSKLPLCNQYFITTFFKPQLRKERTRLFPPILRAEILAATPRRGEHLLVYTTGEENQGLQNALAKAEIECRIYGMRREIQKEQIEANLRFRPFSEAQFIDDLSSCRAVIAGGGFTLMGEAVYLHKPMLAIPLKRQFEQILNARYLKLEGYGGYNENIEDVRPIRAFLKAVPNFESNLALYSQNGNQEIFDAIDEWLDKAETGSL